MTQENKELQLKDLCARLPYGVKIEYNNSICEVLSIDKYNEELTIRKSTDYSPIVYLVDIKPYLFPLSSMTEEHQREEYYICAGHIIGYESNLIDFYNKYNYDYRGLIPMGLAIDATGLNIY